ncbi:MAG TPA: cobalamin-dependent protein, partial [Verrucomicrobiae bacterium]|nr:cobalamin-dependent protein [Verrucomicrobiae bacterium]
MSLRILLVVPAGERVRVTLERPEVPPRAMLRFSVLSLTIVAALTPRRHPVRIIDENVEPLDFNTGCDLVGITFMTSLAPRAYEIAAEFHRRGKLVVAGGYHPTLCPQDAALHFDSLVLGDAKGAWEQLLVDA